MSPDAIKLLQQNVGRIVQLTCTDGEVIAKIILVDLDDEEIVYDMVSTTTESRYKKPAHETAYLTRFNEISGVEVVGV